MRKILLEAFGGPEVMEVGDHPEPECPEDGWIVEVGAASINYADVVSRRGLYSKDQQLPFEVGKEAAGTIVAAGPSARGFELGEQVIVIKFEGGCYAERVAARPGQLLRGPTGYDVRQLAAFGILFATAWFGQNEIARVRSGESVLIQAAAGGVGSTAVTLARSFDCGPVIGTAGDAEKCAWVESLGADACVNYREDDFREVVRELTGGRGVDYCLESVGGDVARASMEVLAEMGRMVIIGFSSISSDYKKVERVHPLTVFHRSLSYCGLNVQNLDFPRHTAVWGRLVDHVEEHGLAPEIGAEFPLEQGAAAHAALESRQTRGKVLLIP